MNGKTVIITGGGAGIGRAVALLCVDRGTRVAVLDLDGNAAAKVADEASGREADAAIGLRCDVMVERDVEVALTESQGRLGSPSGVFANAGVDFV